MKKEPSCLGQLVWHLRIRHRRAMVNCRGYNRVAADFKRGALFGFLSQALHRCRQSKWDFHLFLDQVIRTLSASFAASLPQAAEMLWDS